MTIFKRFIKFGLIIIVLFLSSIFITYLSLLYKPESIFFIANKTIAKNYSFEYSEINWELIAKEVRFPTWVFDARSILKSSEVIEAGLNLWKIGYGFNEENS